MGWGLARSTSGRVIIINLAGVGLIVVVGVGAVVVGVRSAAPGRPALGTGVVGVVVGVVVV